MPHAITGVAPHSPASRAGLREGDALVAVNGEVVADVVDYEALTAARALTLSVARAGGALEEVRVVKSAATPLGLSFGDSMKLTPKRCQNACVFCFIDQMPPGLRDTLYVKDDDWRFSLMMGNYITLTNVSDAEFARILRRRASPLYVSVHATDPDVRARMMRNPRAAELMPRLRALRDAGLRFHAQVVLCPGVNDGDTLRRTLRDLMALRPASRSVALVPVGLTRYRDRCAPIAPFTKDAARDALHVAEGFQRECREALGTAFVFPADELYCLAERPIPPDEAYEDYPQIENGVGLMRLFAERMREADEAARGEPAKPEALPRRNVLIPTGVSAAPYLQGLLNAYAPPGARFKALPVRNDFFGALVTVTGLLTGGDILAQTLPALAGYDEVAISRVTLRAEGDRFLDDMTLNDFRAALPVPLTVVDNTGDALYRFLKGAD